MIPEWPGWSGLQFYISDDQISYNRRIELCDLNDFVYTMCDDTDPAPADQAGLNNVLSRWDDLITNKNYKLTVGYDGQTLAPFNLFLFGSEMDPMASNLPMSVVNSVILEE